MRRRADVVFRKQKLAVFIDGCFWHACPVHASWPQHNGAWWQKKLLRNRTRDSETTSQLETKGWTVLRFWEHNDPKVAAKRVAATLKALSERNNLLGA